MGLRHGGCTMPVSRQAGPLKPEASRSVLRVMVFVGVHAAVLLAVLLVAWVA
jgi:hypothetical protein